MNSETNDGCKAAYMSEINGIVYSSGIQLCNPPN